MNLFEETFLKDIPRARIVEPVPRARLLSQRGLDNASPPFAFANVSGYSSVVEVHFFRTLPL